MPVSQHNRGPGSTRKILFTWFVRMRSHITRKQKKKKPQLHQIVYKIQISTSSFSRHHHLLNAHKFSQSFFTDLIVWLATFHEQRKDMTKPKKFFDGLLKHFNLGSRRGSKIWTTQTAKVVFFFFFFLGNNLF